MKILESVDYVITLPTGVEELAILLDNDAMDWATTLDFLCKVASRQGIHLDRRGIIAEMTKMYGDGR